MKPAFADFDPQRLVIEAIQAGDADAMAEFVATHDRWLRGVVFGVLGRTDGVDDVCQKVWIKVWQESRQLSDPAAWRSWLYRVARNVATDWLRTCRRRTRLGEMASADIDAAEASAASPAGTPESELIARERHEAMLRAIGDLPPLYREPFVLKHVEGLSYAQIGEVLGLGTETVETRLVRARRLLRERLAGRT